MGAWIYFFNKFVCQFLGLTNIYIEEEVMKIAPMSFLSVEDEQVYKKAVSIKVERSSINDKIDAEKSAYFKDN